MAWSARRVDPTGSKVFFILVGVALVGIGVAQWRSEMREERPSPSEFGPLVHRRLPPAVIIGAGLAAIVFMTVALLDDP